MEGKPGTGLVATREKYSPGVVRPKTQFRLKLCRQCGSVALIKSLSISELHLVATCRLLFLYLEM